jgi:thiosulfate dehydrogenase [quinone] large subunit
MKIPVLLLRLGMGWLFLYAGLSKVLNPTWSSAGYLRGAKTFPNLYAWFALPQNIGWVDFLNEWGLTLIGVSLILGAAVRWSALAGIALMALYYFPVLNFPYVGEHSYLVDEHVIYALVFLLLYFARAGEYWGLDRFVRFKK